MSNKKIMWYLIGGAFLGLLMITATGVGWSAAWYPVYAGLGIYRMNRNNQRDRKAREASKKEV